MRRLVAGFPPRRPGFEPWSGHMGFVVDKVALAQLLFRVVLFPMPALIPPVAPYSSSIIRVWYNGPVAAAVPNGLSLTPPQETKGRSFFNYAASQFSS
jgi:hypothetical protein